MDVLTREQRRRCMTSISGKHTKPEQLVAKLMRGLGQKVRRYRRDLPGTPDFVLLGTRQAIFVNGCFWHRHRCRYGSVQPATNVEFWRRKFEENVKRDRRNRRSLRSSGWSVLVVWECETRNPSRLRSRLAGLYTHRNTPIAPRSPE